MTEPEVTIEYPATGATYTHDMYGVYQYDVYPEGSVLEGQTRRTSLGIFDTLEKAQENFPEAQYEGEGTCYTEIVIPTSPPDWFDPDAAGETWDEDC